MICTSTVSDSGNLEIRLEGVLFVSKQSLKELRDCARSASDSVLGQGDTSSTPPALHPVLILFSAESSCQRRAEGSAAGKGRQRAERRKPKTSGTTEFILVMAEGKRWNGTRMKSLFFKLMVQRSQPRKVETRIQGLKLLLPSGLK